MSAKLPKGLKKAITACALRTNLKFAAHKYQMSKQNVAKIVKKNKHYYFLPWERDKADAMTFNEVQWYLWEKGEMVDARQ